MSTKAKGKARNTKKVNETETEGNNGPVGGEPAQTVTKTKGKAKRSGGVAKEDSSLAVNQGTSTANKKGKGGSRGHKAPAKPLDEDVGGVESSALEEPASKPRRSRNTKKVKAQEDDTSKQLQGNRQSQKRKSGGDPETTATEGANTKKRRRGKG